MKAIIEYSGKVLIAICLVVAAVAGVLTSRKIGKQADGSILIPTGQTLTPAGTHIEVSDRPLGIVLSPDGRLLAVATGSNFSPRSLHLIDTNPDPLCSPFLSVTALWVWLSIHRAGSFTSLVAATTT